MQTPLIEHPEDASINRGIVLLGPDGTILGGDERFLGQMGDGAAAVGRRLTDFAPGLADPALCERVRRDRAVAAWEGPFRVGKGPPCLARIVLQPLVLGGDAVVQATIELYADDGRWTVLPPDSRKYALLADNIPALIGYWDNELRCRYANNAYLEWFRRPARTILGMHIRELLGEEVYQLNLPYIEGALKGVPQSFERTLTKGDNSQGHVWAQYIPDISGDGRVDGFYVLVTDITLLRESQRLLFEANTLKDTVISSTRSLIIATDPGGVVTLFNREAEQALGYAASEVVGRQTPALWHLPEEVAAYAESVSRELGTEVPPGFDAFVRKADIFGFDENEWTFERKDGTRFPVSLTVTPLKSSGGGTSGYLGVITDITHRREIETMKDELISTVSHELRTPLTSIKGALDLLANGQVATIPEDGRPLIDMACRNADRLSRIIDDIIDIDRMTSGRLPVELRTEDVLEQIFTATDLNGAAFAAGGLSLVIDRDSVSLTVRVDRNRLQQVIGNILSNAVKFSYPRTETTIGTRREGERARIWVRNFGPEIPKTFHDRMFKRFSQANASVTRGQGGSGLGLHISKLLVETMHGDIGYDSTPSGTTFWIEFSLLAETGADGRRLS